MSIDKKIKIMKSLIKSVTDSDTATKALVKSNRIYPIDVDTALNVLYDDRNGLKVLKNDNTNKIKKLDKLINSVNDSRSAIKALKKANDLIPIITDTVLSILYTHLSILEVEKRDYALD